MSSVLPQRLRYPALLVYLLGGLLGSGINFALTFALHRWMAVPAPLAFFLGTLANELFHHVFYHVVYVNQEIRLRTPLLLQVMLYIIVAAAAGTMLHLM